MRRQIQENNKINITNGAVTTGIPLLQIPIGECMRVPRPIIMTIPGDILGDGMAVIAHIGAGTVDGAGIWDCPGAGADPSAGAGVALLDGEARIGDILLTGAAIMIHSGADIMDIHTGAMEATGVAITDLHTEEVVRMEEDLSETPA